MRTIDVSPDVFAAIWKNQKPGEAAEDIILRRVLGVRTAAPQPGAATTLIGFSDARFGATFPPGFEIFRVYLGKEYRAKALGGAWVSAQDGKSYQTLSDLSRSAGIDHENVWTGWFYLDAKGVRRSISDMRDPRRISSRKKRPTLSDI